MLESQLNRGNTMGEPDRIKRYKEKSICTVKLDISINQNPDLYALFKECSSRGTLAREMLEFARKNMPELNKR